ATWPVKPLASLIVADGELSRTIRMEDRHHADYSCASLICEPILKYRLQEERQPDVWFVVVPDEVFLYGRPKSVVPHSLRESSADAIGKKAAIDFLRFGDLFDDFADQARMYQFDLDFHSQLKARLLGTAVLQIVRESTLTGVSY